MAQLMQVGVNRYCRRVTMEACEWNIIHRQRSLWNFIIIKVLLALKYLYYSRVSWEPTSSAIPWLSYPPINKINSTHFNPIIHCCNRKQTGTKNPHPVKCWTQPGKVSCLCNSLCWHIRKVAHRESAGVHQASSPLSVKVHSPNSNYIRHLRLLRRESGSLAFNLRKKRENINLRVAGSLSFATSKTTSRVVMVICPLRVASQLRYLRLPLW
jgi:hypothetical protein